MSDRDKRVTVVLPAFQEESRIGRAVREVRRAVEQRVPGEELEVIVVDDGSTDDTAGEAERAAADRVIRLPDNRGKGAAVRAGVLAARGRTVAFTDADLAYEPELLLEVLAGVEAGSDVVVGSRLHADATTLVRARRLREVGGRLINLLTRRLVLGQTRDTQCGLKAFDAEAATLLFGKARLDGFAFDVELFHLIGRYGFSLSEVPVRVTHSRRSSVHVLPDAARLVRDLFRIRRWERRGAYDSGGPAARPEGPGAEAGGPAARPEGPGAEAGGPAARPEGPGAEA